MASFRDALIVGLGAAMGIQNAAARTIAVPDLTTTVLTLTITGIAAGSTRSAIPLAIALVTIVFGPLASHILGKRDPARVRAPARNSRPDCRQRKVEERKMEER